MRVAAARTSSVPTSGAGTARFRFYEELNDFLPPQRRRREFSADFRERPSVKDMIEALGVPHTEIDLVLVNGRSVGFGERLADGDRVSVYPMFERFDISPLLRLRPKPLRVTRFVLDVHLGRLARYLRLLGFDTLYRNDFGDAELAEQSDLQRRILLTRDVGLLKRSRVTRGAYLRQTAPREQLREVVDRFDLRGSLKPYSRCMHCNGRLARIARAQLAGRLDANILQRHARFRQCRDCGRLYWPGTHLVRLQALIDGIAAGGAGEPLSPAAT